VYLCVLVYSMCVCVCVCVALKSNCIFKRVNRFRSPICMANDSVLQFLSFSHFCIMFPLSFSVCVFLSRLVCFSISLPFFCISLRPFLSLFLFFIFFALRISLCLSYFSSLSVSTYVHLFLFLWTSSLCFNLYISLYVFMCLFISASISLTFNLPLSIYFSIISLPLSLSRSFLYHQYPFLSSSLLPFSLSLVVEALESIHYRERSNCV